MSVNTKRPISSLLQDVCYHFSGEYYRPPEVVVEAPGRVNLIGEHVDYSGYAVLPMALDQRFYAAIAKSSYPELRLNHVDAVHYKRFCVPLETDYQIASYHPEWYDYFLCGFRGVVEYLKEHKLSKSLMKFPMQFGINVMIGSDIPPSAGLSSSSALVCCAALCALYAFRDNEGDVFESIDRKTLAEICMRSERYCGTEGGGMDQAICFLAERHKAKLIEFNPLGCRDVSLPMNACFVVCNTGVKVDKAASQKYNERVVECRLAAQVLACYFGEDWKAVRTLRDAQEAGHKTLEEMSMFVKENLHTQSYGIDEICSILKTTEDELMALSFPPDTYSKNKFELQRRALHVFAEAARVYQFELFLKQLTDGTIQLTDDAIEYLGKLMNESHISCRNLFECSCTELEDLRTFCLSNGAVGCRLTGAGWGGATVSIVKEKMLDKFCKNLRYFYKSKGLSDERIAKNMIVSCAGDGAKITNRKAIHLAI